MVLNEENINGKWICLISIGISSLDNNTLREIKGLFLFLNYVFCFMVLTYIHTNAK